MIRLFHISKAFYRTKQPKWPQPITQQTIGEFLRDINYFDQPKTSIDISLKLDTEKINTTAEVVSTEKKPEQKSIDDILNYRETEVPPLDPEDVKLELNRLVDLAQYYGIYRDLFGTFTQSRDNIHFTPDQARRMARLVPDYWITDQPHARAKRNVPEPEPMKFFKPYVNLSARFVSPIDDNEIQGHHVYHGNHIAACDTVKRPSITLDGRLLSKGFPRGSIVGEKQYNNWHSGLIETINFDDNFEGYLSLLLVNLDSIVPNIPTVHWMVSNIKPGSNNYDKTDEICDYLPVYGIKGFGYSRYVFLVFSHRDKLDNEKLNIGGHVPSARTLDLNQFLSDHRGINLTPVGLSWFQTCWDESSNRIFHEHFKLKAPEYEHVQTRLEKREDVPYPGKIPFNIYLDHNRDKKDINEQVLLERLKRLDPFDYKDQYVAPKVPETVFFPSDPLKKPPSWMYSVELKKANKIGYWRGLRPASATLPLNNNSDLDYPIRPLETPDRIQLDDPNEYIGNPRKKMIIDTPMARPPNEHESVFVQETHTNIDLHEIRKIVDEMSSEKEARSKKSKKQKSAG